MIQGLQPICFVFIGYNSINLSSIDGFSISQISDHIDISIAIRTMIQSSQSCRAPKVYNSHNFWGLISVYNDWNLVALCDRFLRIDKFILIKTPLHAAFRSRQVSDVASNSPGGDSVLTLTIIFCKYTPLIKL